MMVCVSGRGQVSRLLLCWFRAFRGAVFEAEAIVSGLQDMAVMGEAIEERGGHLGIAKDGGPFAEAKIGGDDDAGALIELGEQVEEQRATRGTEGRYPNSSRITRSEWTRR